VWDLGDEGQSDPSRRITRELLTDHVTQGLTREERLVIILYYFEGLTMAEIGTVLNLSESRVSQIHKEILQRLRVRYQSVLAEEMVA
jgi:RNA polymerase sigma factor for flagellar operon FliA